MSKSNVFWSAAAAAMSGALALGYLPAQAAVRRAQPERALLGVSLGRPFLDVIKRYNQPNEVQTVALANSPENLPGLNGSASASSADGYGFGGMTAGGGGMMGSGGSGMMGSGMGGGGGVPPGFGGMAGMGGGGMRGSMGMMGGGPGGGGMRGMMGSGMGGGGNAPGGGGMMGMMGSGMGGPGGIPVLPPAGGGMGMMGAMGGGMGGEGGMMGGEQQMPEYSNAILWIYHRPVNARLEFLVNEDGRIAQISAASPANRPYPGVRTSRGIGLGSTYAQVLQAYGNPERNRMVPGLRFYEVYYTKKNHAAFTLDTKAKGGMKVVRVTIALAD